MFEMPREIELYLRIAVREFGDNIQFSNDYKSRVKVRSAVLRASIT